MVKGDTHAHVGPIWYHSEPSDVPYFTTQFLGCDLFSVSYSKPALVAYQRLNLPSFIVSTNPLLWAGSCSLFHVLIFGILNIFRIISVLSNLAWPTDIMAVQLQYNVTAYLGNKYLVDKMFQNEPEIAIITKARFIFFRGLVIIEDSCQKE